MRVGGQVALVLPGGPCLRCMGLVTDARVEAGRLRRQGYAEAAPEPQVVSLNGSLASEGVTAALMVLAGEGHFVAYRRFAYPPGTLTEVQTAQRTDCRACAGAHLIRTEEDGAPDHTAGGTAAPAASGGGPPLTLLFRVGDEGFDPPTSAV